MKPTFKHLTALLLALLLLCGCAPQDTPAALTYEGPVSYLGPEGTYTQEATQQFFGQEGDYRPQKTVGEAVDRLLDGSCAFAVIPQENTIGGPVYNYVDELLSHPEVSIVGEVELPIRQALLTAEGTELSAVTTVYSHAQGIAQGKDWVAENLPQAELVEVSSTAEGAKMVAESGDPHCAAIASTGAAGVYGLKVAAENIQQNEDNVTRFYVLSLQPPLTQRSHRMVFTATGSAADLPDLLKAMEKRDIPLVTIHDRTEQTTLGQYVYLIECESADHQDFEALADSTGLTLHYYGAFPIR